MYSLVTASLIVFCLSASGIMAEQAAANDFAHGGGAHGGPRLAVMALNLFDIGKARKDPQTVLTAARLMALVGMQDGGPLTKETIGDATAEETAGAAAQPLTAAEMLAAARGFALQDDLLLTLIDAAEAETASKPVGGTIARLSHLSGGRTDRWEVPYFGNAPAELAIIGDGDANLDVTVEDASDQRICVDLSPSDRMFCDFVPAENGYVHVTVKNTGTAQNSYYLLTN